MNRYLPSLLATALALFVMPNVTNADSTFFDRASYESNLDSSDNVDFEIDYTSGNWAPFLTSAGYTSNGVNFFGTYTFSSNYLYIGESSINGYGNTYGLSDGDFLLGEGRGRIDITLPAGHNAVGFDFAISEWTFGAPVSVTYKDSTGNSIDWLAQAGQEQFFGIISDNELTTVSFETTNSTRPPMLIMDNFTFGSGSTGVPEPSTMLVVVALGLGTVSRRRH